MELIVSNAERRALLHNETLVLPRVGDLYAALPGITGKLELEYEGELRGADTVVKEVVRTAIGKVFDKYFAEMNTQQIEQWFNLGGTTKIEDAKSAKETLNELHQIQGLFEKLSPLGVEPNNEPEAQVAAAEFLLEGMVSHRRLSRSEERTFSAQRKQQSPKQERVAMEPEYQEWQSRRSRRGSLN
jgi:magnesium chelatase subunit I